MPACSYHPLRTLLFGKAKLIDRHCGSEFTTVRVQHKKWAGVGSARLRNQVKVLATLPTAIGVLYSTLVCFALRTGDSVHTFVA